jgi:hypothetical protein
VSHGRRKGQGLLCPTTRPSVWMSVRGFASGDEKVGCIFMD